MGVLRYPLSAAQAVIKAQRGPVHDLPESNIGPAQRQATNPDESARSVGVTGVALPARADGVNDGEVPVKADAGQEKDATVAVERQEGAGDLAERQAEHPLVSPLHRKQGEGERQQQVGNGQVKEEGVAQGGGARPPALGAPVASDHAHHQHIANDSQDEQQAVNHGGVPLSKAVDVLLPAGCCVVKVNGQGGIVILIRFLLLGQGEGCEYYSRKVNMDGKFSKCMYET